MGTILAQNIITNVSLVLQDTPNVQWSAAELLEWLNDGQSQIAVYKPDVSSVTANITTVAGTKQSIPASWNRLLDVVRNMGTGTTPGRAILKVNRRTLDMLNADWHSETTVAAAKHFVYDPQNPRVFYLYPPMQAGRAIEAVGAVAPTRLSSAAQAISLDDIWAPVLHDYMLYRAYTKDGSDGNPSRAALHLKAFSDAVGVKAASDVAADAQQQPAMGGA